MAYHIKASESIPDNIKRIVTEEVDAALASLSVRSPRKRGEAIHEARKNIKKIRGLLRLVQPELGRTYRDESTRLRDIGRKLSEIRDAYAVIETFDALVNRYSAQIQSKSLQPLRRALEARKSELEKNTNGSSTASLALSALRSLRHRVAHWPLTQDGFDAIEAGLKQSYRRGRQALARARSNPTADNFHEFRKRVKDHWYHIRLLEKIWAGPMAARENSLKDLQDWLGDDHNLCVLKELIEGDPKRFGKGDETRLFLTLGAKVQEELRANSVSLGERLFEEKPKQFRKSMERLWDAWQAQPDTFKHAQDDKSALPARKAGPARAQNKSQVA